jgi:cytolethal distending toxin subunit B
VNITTWNLQGGSASSEAKWLTGVHNIFQGSVVPPDVVCLQEAGGIPGSAVRTHTATRGPFGPFVDPNGHRETVTVWEWGGTSRRGGQRTIIHHNWDTGANRVNTAIVTGTALAWPFNIQLVWSGRRPTWRPALGVEVQGRWIFSFHAIARGGPDAFGVLSRVAAMIPPGVPWFVGGDFNREPVTLVVPANSVVCPPDQPTHSAVRPPATSRKDYFVCSGNHPETGSVDTMLVLSDHLMVDFSFP